jgi:hypothetical protein
MRDSYEYAVIRIVPRVEREEFVNVGIGANYIGETSTTASPNGLGAVAVLSVGF